MKSGNRGLQVGQFCTLQTSDFANKYGVKKGDTLYVAGDGIVNVGAEDPYELRRILVCAKVDSGGHILADAGAITIDGLKLKAVSKAKQSKLDAIKVVDFGEDLEVPDDTAN